MRAQIATLEAQPRLTEAQQKALDKLNAQEAAAVAKAPEFLEDPKGYVDAKAAEVADGLKKLSEAEQQRANQERAQAEVTQLVTAVGTREAEFVKTTPDYHEAVNHIRNVRGQQLQMLYPQATTEQILRQITTEEITAARHIMSQGGNPADFAYKYAKTVGYVPKTQAAAGANTSAAAIETRIDKEAARSLGGGGGADSTGEEVDDSREIPELTSALQERFGVKGKKK